MHALIKSVSQTYPNIEYKCNLRLLNTLARSNDHENSIKLVFIFRLHGSLHLSLKLNLKSTSFTIHINKKQGNLSRSLTMVVILTKIHTITS